ncbi:MAG: hypothetical protein N2749_03780 [Clostridia bacterium]|nr:hypothetical protein [Clostridia bacterium]
MEYIGVSVESSSNRLIFYERNSGEVIHLSGLEKGEVQMNALAISGYKDLLKIAKGLINKKSNTQEVLTKNFSDKIEIEKVSFELNQLKTTITRNGEIILN